MLWLVITGYSVLIAIVYLCNGEMDACYEIKDSQFIDIPNTIPRSESMDDEFDRSG